MNYNYSNLWLVLFMNDSVKIETLIAMAKPLNLSKSRNLEDLRTSLDQVCSQVAQHFSFFNSNKKPRKATIISVIAETPCIACITKRLSAQATVNRVDALYTECHKLAVNVLVEELYNLLRGMGYNVIISTETALEYGKADVAIRITNYGIDLKCETNELLVEVKTGNSFSLCQLFRYLIDKRSNTILAWRIRRRQILVFNAENIKPLLMEFMRIICLRGNRLLSSPNSTCQHTQRQEYNPTQEALQEMFQDFAKALLETLPQILEAIVEKLGIDA